jgi:hypothetical protein
MKTRKIELHRGTYKGVSFEVNNFDRPGLEPYNDCWTFYLFLHVSRCPKELQGELWLKGELGKYERVNYDYTSGLLASIEWHCGITYYAKKAGFDGEGQTIKAGCDYSHLWDEGMRYNVEMVLSDIEKAIDSVYKLFPGYKCYCQGHGGLYLPELGSFNESGEFYSDEWKAKNESKVAE